MPHFNGAAVHHGGVEPKETFQSPTYTVLQWGRRSSRRSGVRREFNSLMVRIGTSMGPPFITAEWMSEGPIDIVSGDGLQWGRRSSRRSGAPAAAAAAETMRL